VVPEEIRAPKLVESFLALRKLSPKRLAQVREMIAAMQHLDKKEYDNTWSVSGSYRSGYGCKSSWQLGVRIASGWISAICRSGSRSG
jgi:hypothetical protein